MEKPKVLSGQVMVAKGITKADASLPEGGLKDVKPNGSWLEQKQIQAALEGRKHLIEVERIEKYGTLSHGKWRDDLKLVEVTQKAGGHWQFFGHNVGETSYLRPEEALFLMEVNCLLLKHNDLTVSLQKAYSLLLNDTISLSQYKVYASLSRLGYKVFKHKVSKVKDKNVGIKPVKSNENFEKQIVVESILKQPLAESHSTSVEILNSKSDAYICEDLRITAIKSIDDEPSINDDNINTETCGEANKLLVKTKDVMEVDEIDSKLSNIPKINSNEIVATNTNLAMNNNIEDKSETHQIEIDNNKMNNIESNNIDHKNFMGIDNKGNLFKLVNNNLSIVKAFVTQQPNKNLETMSTKTSNIEQETEEIGKTHLGDKNSVNESLMDVDNNENLFELTIDNSSPKESFQSSSIINSANVEINTSIMKDKKLEITIKSHGDCNLDISTPVQNEIQSATNDSDDFEAAANINTTDVLEIPHTRDLSFSNVLVNKRSQLFEKYVTMLKKLTSRQCKPCDIKILNKSFEYLPDLLRKEVISINVPEQQYIPQNIFVNKHSYVLNIEKITTRPMRTASNDSTVYSSDEVNGNHIRRLRNTPNTDVMQSMHFRNNLRFPPQHNLYFRPYPFWRPQNNLNYVQFSMFFQRPSYANTYFQPRFQYQPRPNQMPRFPFPNDINLNDNNWNASNTRKRARSAKATHLQSIKNLAFRLKQLIMSGNIHMQNIQSLHRLLYAYNTRYKTRLKLTKEFEVVNDEIIVETIDLEDEGESANKKPKSGQDMFNENLDLLRQLAFKLKDLNTKNKATSKYKRALSKAIKTFNKSYDADIYMNYNFEVINRRHIHIASDSESDCVIEEPQKVHKKKRLRNPFNILKRRSEKAQNYPSTSKDNTEEQTMECDINDVTCTEHTLNSENLSNIFNKNWLPSNDDFGRADITLKSLINCNFMDVIEEEYLLNFIKNRNEEFNNWLEAKITLLQHLEETDSAFQNQQDKMANIKDTFVHSGIKPLVDADGCLNNASALEKLRIIHNNKAIETDTNLNIDYDVYNRDVQNFRKTKPPKPHFRIICIEESSSFPSTAEVTALLSKYDDNVPIVFAIVGISSVSYLQMNPIDLPVYVPSDPD